MAVVLLRDTFIGRWRQSSNNQEKDFEKLTKIWKPRNEKRKTNEKYQTQQNVRKID